MKKVLTIAGSDCSGGAGIQADIKTITAHKMYAMSVITALTAQNTTGVYGVLDTEAAFVAQQLDCVFTDIRPDAVKIGMVSNPQIITIIVEKLRHYQARNIVVDPVMVATSGSTLMAQEAQQSLREQLLPLATVITPNLHEAEVLTGCSIHTDQQMLAAAEQLQQMTRTAVLLKGGHMQAHANDLLVQQGEAVWFYGQRVENPNSHGTGCTLSAAIACNLAAGNDLAEAVRLAKEYITGALSAQLDLGQGRGPLCHTYAL